MEHMGNDCSLTKYRSVIPSKNSLFSSASSASSLKRRMKGKRDVLDEGVFPWDMAGIVIKHLSVAVMECNESNTHTEIDKSIDRLD